ncbi:MAG: hypothetical protein GX807_01185 [Erysipelotrichia bacterium]|nr:hypothetical protein [Bacilli bacterium]NLB49420.1 hypothetical protein [Erysipelotrichia bacterium]
MMSSLKSRNVTNGVMKKTRIKKQKKPLTYVEAHNKAYWAFHKSSRILLWAGILNIAGLLIGLIQAYAEPIYIADYIEGSILFTALGGKTTLNFSLGFAMSAFFSRLIELAALPIAGFIVLIVIISIIFSALGVFLGVFSAQGKKWALFTGFGFYLLDTAFIVGCYLIGEPVSFLWIFIGVHFIVLGFLCVAIFQYYHLHTIEKVYHSAEKGDKQ